MRLSSSSALDCLVLSYKQCCSVFSIIYHLILFQFFPLSSQSEHVQFYSNRLQGETLVMFSLCAHYNLRRKVIIFTSWTVHRWLSSNRKVPVTLVPRWNGEAASWGSAPVSASRRLWLLPWAAGEHFADKLGGTVAARVNVVFVHVVKFWNDTIFLFSLCCLCIFFYLHIFVFFRNTNSCENFPP